MSGPGWFYRAVVTVGRFVFWQSSRATVLHRDRVPRAGPFILAANHVSPFDPAVLMRHTPRPVEFVTMAELFDSRMGWFFRGMRAIPVSRGRADARAVLGSVERLGQGRVVGIFPEGRVRADADSAVAGAPFNDGAVRIAKLARVPIVPAVVRGTRRYRRWYNWFPRKAVRYGVIYGPPIAVDDPNRATRQLAGAWRSLHHELAAAMRER